MRNIWFTKDYEHIPMTVKEKADSILTKKFEIEERIVIFKELLDFAVIRATVWPLSEDNIAESIDAYFKETMQTLLQLYVAYYQFEKNFEDLLLPYSAINRCID